MSKVNFNFTVDRVDADFIVECVKSKYYDMHRIIQETKDDPTLTDEMKDAFVGLLNEQLGEIHNIINTIEYSMIEDNTNE